jgi:hypothetical protein
MLMRPPRWRSESAFADALYLLIRSQARSFVFAGIAAETVAQEVQTGLKDIIRERLGLGEQDFCGE